MCDVTRSGQPSLSRTATLVVAVAFGVLVVVPRAYGADPPAANQAARFELRPGDHVCLIGNTLAERMQHDGWLETLLYARFPKHDLVIRNLGFSADELTVRLRSMDFGTPDQWLSGSAPVPQPGKLTTRIGVRENRFETTGTAADVIFAFFGYNESFGGKEGLPKFKSDLEAFVTHTLGQKYNGKSAPRLVLFSPIPHEDLHDRNLPDGRENNARIALYTKAMAEVAAAKGVPFVDLYTPMLSIYARSDGPLTINGIHLNDEGNHVLATIINLVLFGKPPEPAPNAAAVESIRVAVLDKNFYWFQRYRTVDGFSTYGDRAFLKFEDGLSNYETIQRELEVLDVMTANRDKRIWAAAQGKYIEVDDGNTPPFIPVKTNKPGSGPNGTHLFLSGDEAISKLKVAAGLKVSLFASEEQFPELAKPVQMAFDTKGRLWVATMPSYPHWKPKDKMNDQLLILEDIDGDGKADKCKVFADKLHVPTGLEFWNGGVFVGQQPDLMFLKDTNGDDVADVRIRVVDGLDSADTHHALNSFTLDPGGALYFQEGTFHHTQVETPYGPPQRCANAGVFRFEPRTQKFEVYVSYPFANPHGHVFNRWGQDIVHDGTGAVPYHGALFSVHVEFPRKLQGTPTVYNQRTRPCPGTEILSSRHFPEKYQGNLLVGNVIGDQGILQYKISDDGSSFSGTEVEPIVMSSDPNFRPSDIEIGPDGAIYFTEWQNPIIGHMQHNLRDPSRDRTHGRVYRVTYPGRPLLKPAKIAGEPIDKLLALLKEPEDRVRYRARIELSGRNGDEVVAAAKSWIAALDQKEPDYEHQLLEGLWVERHHNLVDPALLKRVLASPDFRARAAATRVLCYSREHLPDALSLLRTLAADEHPRVRLEAVRAASFFTVPEAVEIPLISAEKSSDKYLDYVRTETLKTLEPYWKKVLADGKKLNVTSDAGLRFLVQNLSIDELLKVERSKGVCLELLFRKGVRDENRREALVALAKIDNKPELQVLVEAIRGQDDRAGAGDESVIFDLIRLLASRKPAELAQARDSLAKLATGAKAPVTRQLGFVALILADGTVEKAWEMATKNLGSLVDLVNAMPMVPDPELRASLYPKVEPLLSGIPKSIAAASKKVGAGARFVRIELNGKRTLTLAEVEVYSAGINVAREGKASQKNTSHGGAASRAIDGNKSSAYGDGGQTHTEENTTDPWWELDLGTEIPVESIVVFNRADGDQGNRLEGFTLKLLDGQRGELLAVRNIPAPKPSASFDVGTAASPEAILRRSAMFAMISVRGQEANTFQALAKFAREGVDRHAAVQAISRIPASYWPAEEAAPLLESLTAYIRKLPTGERTSPAALDAIQLGYSLAPLLPVDQAKAIRRELGELGVQVLRIGTLTDQMLFDKERLVIQAGKPVEFVFENTDIMPHNFVIVRQGALEEVGVLAESQATQPGALERHYVPGSDKILLSSPLLQPRQSQKLSFVAPKETGVYPYVCTYPGHWRRMYGALYVVENLEDYLADAEGYLAAHPVEIRDTLLKFNRPRKEWKLEELTGAVAELDHGHPRSFGNGKQMFQIAGCVSCHKLSGTGQEFGPDLAKLDPKLKPADILKEIFDPSAKIDEKYKPQIIELNSGKVVTGLVVEETPEALKLVENPLAKADPVVIRLSDISERKKSATSIMPKGLFDKLTREEILDLIAFVASKGDQNHKFFQGVHDHHH